MLTSSQIRQQFIDFFVQKCGHAFVPSSSVVPHGDDTLLFANAGMNQFKPYFLGAEKPPHPRVANTQKCIRAGGKHNDLDDVGKDTYHHTFFEMLGNWSFGDYFKKDAIAWAWELLTVVWQLDPTRLHVTVFEGDPANGIPRDDEAAGFWKAAGVPPERIHLGNKQDNFWEMGSTGPCGPCTEVHYDHTEDKTGAQLVNGGTPKVVEIWNLVFIQFNRNEDQSLTPLPAQHVDTGMGFERLTAILQGKSSNYDSDVFTPIMDAFGKLTGKTYGGKLDDMADIGFRVVADHLRMAVFAIADGARPGAKKRDAVLRSVIRRAVRYGYQQFDLREPFLYKLVPVVVEQMGQAFPELKANPAKVSEIIRKEEADFFKSIERGLVMFWESATKAVQSALLSQHIGQIVSRQRRSVKEISYTKQSDVPVETTRHVGGTEIEYSDKSGQTYDFVLNSDPMAFSEEVLKHCKQVPEITGKQVFDLHASLGFPPDLTQQMAMECKLSVDMAGYQVAMEEHEAISSVGSKSNIISAVQGELPATDDSAKYKGMHARGVIQAWVKENLVGTGSLQVGNEVALVLDKTNFYAEQGGQVGDCGWIKTDTGTFEVTDTQRLGASVLHLGRVWEGTVKTGQKATLEVHPLRFDTMRNHTSTHLMNWALREVLGEHVEQKGSLVDADKTRYDFTHDKPMTPDEVSEVERLVNEKILADLPVTPLTMPLAEAKQIGGVRAVFGEKYPDPVRVVLIGAEKPGDATVEQSVEFCGGTHLSRTSQACLFKIVGQEGVAKGVRRLTAVTGPKALAVTQHQAGVLGELSSRLNVSTDQLATRVETLQDEIKKLQAQLKKGAASDLAGVMDKLLKDAAKIGDITVVIGEVPGVGDDAIRTQVDRIKQTAGSSVVVVGWVQDDKVGLLAAVSDDVVKKGVKAGDLVKEAAKLVGGSGGGRPNMAQAGGKDPAKLGEALAVAKQLVAKQLGQG